GTGHVGQTGGAVTVRKGAVQGEAEIESCGSAADQASLLDLNGGNAGAIDLTGTTVTLAGDLLAKGGAKVNAGLTGAGGNVTSESPTKLNAALVTIDVSKIGRASCRERE